MRNVCNTIISASDAASINGPTIVADQLVSISFIATFSDTDVAGSFKVQVSNEKPNAGYMNIFVPSRWVDLPNSSQTITAGAAAIVSVPQSCYQFMRVVFTATTPGTGTITVDMNGLSV